MRVLVVEDDSKIAAFAAQALRKEGFTVDHTPDGAAAEKLARSTTFDLGYVFRPA